LAVSADAPDQNSKATLTSLNPTHRRDVLSDQYDIRAPRRFPLIDLDRVAKCFSHVLGKTDPHLGDIFRRRKPSDRDPISVGGEDRPIDRAAVDLLTVGLDKLIDELAKGKAMEKILRLGKSRRPFSFVRLR
jgi:hypothetical protein